MILQIANIIAGFMLAAPKLAEWGGKEYVEKAKQGLAQYIKIIGSIELALGVFGLLERMGILRIYIPRLGASFPQAIPAILVGLILCAAYFESMPAVSEQIEKLKPYQQWIGIIAIVSGLNSILFGCQLCSYY